MSNGLYSLSCTLRSWGHFNRERIVSGSKNGAICVWNTATGTTLEGSPFKGYIDYVIFVAFSQDGKQIISGFSDGTIHAWNATTGAMEGSLFTEYTDWVRSVKFSQDGKLSGLLGFGKTLIRDGSTCLLQSFAISQDGKRIVSGFSDCTIRVWNTKTGAMEGSPFTGHTDWISVGKVAAQDIGLSERRILTGLLLLKSSRS